MKEYGMSWIEMVVALVDEGGWDLSEAAAYVTEQYGEDL